MKQEEKIKLIKEIIIENFSCGDCEAFGLMGYCNKCFKTGKKTCEEIVSEFLDNNFELICKEN